MTTVEVSLTEEELQAPMRGDRGFRELMESSCNEVLEVEMTEHLGAEPDERTDEREGGVPSIRWTLNGLDFASTGVRSEPRSENPAQAGVLGIAGNHRTRLRRDWLLV